MMQWGGTAMVGRSESQDRWENALVIQLEDFLGWKEQVRTVNSNAMYNLSGMTKKHGLLQTSTWEEIVILSKRSKLSLK